MNTEHDPIGSRSVTAPRTVIVTGKGGVGKTSVAAATALRGAAAGHRTIVVSTDPAHSLADSLDATLGDEPVPIADRLWGQEVRARAEMETHWAAIREWMSRLLAGQGVDELRAEELTVPPGLDELLALLRIRDHHRSGKYDLIVVDCAPTGETLRLLGFPEVARWWLERAFPLSGRLAGAARPLARSLEIPMPEAGVLEEVRALASRLVEIDGILRDEGRTSIRLVLNPDRMVIREAQRTYTHLCLYGYRTDAVIANRLLPEHFDGSHLSAWRQAQARNLEGVREGFAPVPVLEAPWLDREAVGTELLAQLGKELYGDGDPAADFGGASARSIRMDGEAAVLRIPAPFAGRDEIGLKQIGEELVLSMGGERRTMILPAALSGRRPAGARMVDGALEIRFRMSEHGDDER